MNRRSVLTLCGFATLLDGYDIQALGLAVPALAAEFKTEPTAFASALSGSLAGMAVGALALAPLGDRIGRKATMIVALLIVGVMTAGATTSTTVFELAAWRIATGLGMGALIPLAVTISAENAPSASRATIVTLVASCAGVGSFLGGFLAPVMEHGFGWRGIFGLGSALPIATGIAFLFWHPERVAGHNTKSKPNTSVSGVSGLLSPAYRFRTALLWVIFSTSLLATYSLISWLPTLLGSAGWSRSDAQRAAGVLALGSILGGLALAWITDRGAPVKGLTIGFAVAAVALAGIGFQPTSYAVWGVLLLAVGAGAIGSQLALGSLAASFYPANLRATGMGWSSGLGRIGSIFGPLLLALLIGLHIPSTAIIASLAFPLALCALCVAALPRAFANGLPQSSERSEL